MPPALELYSNLKAGALASLEARTKLKKKKTSKVEGLFKQVSKCTKLLSENPRHPGLQTHHFTSIEHPYNRNGKVSEAYVQQHTPSAYRVLWCYGTEQSNDNDYRCYVSSVARPTQAGLGNTSKNEKMGASSETHLDSR
jgi:hypothetical protein